MLKRVVFLHHRNNAEAMHNHNLNKGVMCNLNNAEAMHNHNLNKGVMCNRNKGVMHNLNLNKGVMCNLNLNNAEAMHNLNKGVMCNLNKGVMCNLNHAEAMCNNGVQTAHLYNNIFLFMLHLLLHVEAKMNIASAEMATMFAEVSVRQLC